MSKITKIFIDNAEDVNTVMPIYNLLKYSEHDSMISESLWNYYRDKINDDGNDKVNNRINNKNTIPNKSFEYKTNSIGRTPDVNNTLDAEVVLLLKNFSNFWRSLDLPLINCKMELDLSWSKEFIIS